MRTGKPQQVSRLPVYRPGDWVRLKETGRPDNPGGQVLRIKALSCCITSAAPALWKAHLDNGWLIECRDIERAATEAEIHRAQGGRPA